MTSRGAVPAALLALAAAAVPAFAESRPEEATTPLALVRGADDVVVADGVAPAPGVPGLLGTLRVREVLRGGLRAGDAVPLAGFPGRDDVRVASDRVYVAILVRRADGSREVQAGALGLLEVAEAPAGLPEDPVLPLFRTLAREVGPGAKVADGARVRAALVAAAVSGSVRLRAGAAFDLVREPGLLDGATDAEREALVRAFATGRAGERARAHLARAVGLLRPEGAAGTLAAALFAEGGATLRPAVGLALADLRDGSALEPLAARAADPSPAVRALVAGTLGWTGLPEARPILEPLLAAAEPAVRLEAAHSLGRLRLADAAPALLRRFRSEAGGAAPEKDDGVRRALAWALAQCDDPAAWSALEDAAANAPDAAFRAHVAAILRNPRRGFVR